jgi:hypothetical protein
MSDDRVCIDAMDCKHQEALALLIADCKLLATKTVFLYVSFRRHLPVKFSVLQISGTDDITYSAVQETLCFYGT